MAAAAQFAVAAWGVARGSVEASLALVGCWDECGKSGMYCSEFCCQPDNGIGNPTCWDDAGHFTYARCCREHLQPEPSESPTMLLGTVTLPLYRGPVNHNQPKFTERTVEIALGLYFMRRSLRILYEKNSGHWPMEVGNVLAQYWPHEEFLHGRYVPWTIADLTDNGLDATHMSSFDDGRILSISTIEHIGYDNEGLRNMHGVRICGANDGCGHSDGIKAWVRAWDEGVSLLGRLVREATEFLVTFPIGFNPRLDAAVSRRPELRRLARVLRRVDAANRWEADPNNSFSYHYDFRDTYRADAVGLIFDPVVPVAYKDVFGEDMPPLLRLPLHPRFRFANAVCVVTNIDELLA